ncbi:MarR family winged helix-turn-helix transcriptional regulator [Anaeromicropila herbilytica]|uniref:Transcriptional regulator n=1 Tax=Anaeromicropila herbilytica TaxID=2785025 RepID=A0A7R7EJI6_9FIRM|nr:MarR family transcriptional regulator [Anaeromicropila herbilytica]BCN30280.1 transcriptional regulator [Anaeromicropila herbilytica]
MEDKLNTYTAEENLDLKTLIVLTRSAQSVHKREYRTIKEGGLTVSQFAVLEVLYHKGELRVCEITDKILSTAGNMTVVIENLIKEDLVKRTIDEKDRRINRISITDKGKELMQGIFPKHLENIKEIFDVLTVEEKTSLISILKKLSGV